MIPLEKAPKARRSPRKELSQAVSEMKPGTAFWLPSADERQDQKIRQAVHAARYYHCCQVTLKSKVEERNSVRGLLFIATTRNKESKTS